MNKFVATLAALVAFSAPHAFADASLYSGKTVRVIVNFAPGGAADTEARLFARFIGGALPGNPQVLAQNIAGGGGLAGANHVGRSAPDGLTMGYLTGVGARAAFEPELFQVPFTQFRMVAYIEGATIYYARRDLKPPLATAADLGKAQNVYAGGLSAGSSKDLTMRLTLEMLGVKHGYITGYAGAGPLRLAFESGEIHMLSDGRATYNISILPMVSAGQVLPLYVDSGYDGMTLFTPKGNRDMGLPPFHEFYKQLRGEAPSGPLWEAYLALLASNTMLQRIIAFPPNVSNAHVETMRKAVRALNTNKDFIDTGTKAFGFVPEYETDEDSQEKIVRMTRVSPQTADFIKGYIAKGQNAGAPR
jgi:tripartite-type tricarboxylate transporter receptor subunit TctC